MIPAGNRARIIDYPLGDFRVAGPGIRELLVNPVVGRRYSSVFELLNNSESVVVIYKYDKEANELYFSY